MSIANINQKDEGGEGYIPWGFENDLATVSCYAATELDNCILNRNDKFYAVNRLVTMIKQSIISFSRSSQPSYAIDPNAALAMNRALEDFDPALKTSLKTIDQLIEKSEEAMKKLEMLMGGTKQFNPDELKSLRTLCISLSKNAFACEEPLDDIDSELL